MAKLGHEVVGVDVDQSRIDALAGGRPPFHEPGFDELLSQTLAAGKLRFTTSVAEAADAQMHFIAVGTPQVAGGYAADMSYVHAAVDSLLPYLSHDDGGPRPLVVGKSTVPVGTAAELAPRIEQAGGLLAWNPEFLREGFAVQDTLSPDRLVYGLPTDPADAAEARALLDEVYQDLLVRQSIPLVATDYATSELVKVSANSFLATKISFINAMSELCDATGADVTVLAKAIGYDERIGPKFLRAGIGFGGGCLPKDIRAFMARAGELGVDQALTFLREVDAINTRRRVYAIDLARTVLGGSFLGKKVAILGAAFKPNSDDMRSSPAIDVANAISGLGGQVVVTDPAAGPVLRRTRPDMTVADDAVSAARGAHLVMVLTEWKDFTTLDPATLGEVVEDRIVIDGRNALDAQAWSQAGWTYHGIGRPSLEPAS